MREDAYRLVQSNAMRAWKDELNFRDLIMSDPEITAKVKRETLEHAFDLKRPLRNVDKIFGGCLARRSSRVRSGAKNYGASAFRVAHEGPMSEC